MRNENRSLDPTAEVLQAVEQERRRQSLLKAAGKFKFTCSDAEMSNCERLAVLMEEVGEAAHEVNEAIGGHQPLDVHALRTELVQVAAVAVAWCEALDVVIAGGVQ